MKILNTNTLFIVLIATMVLVSGLQTLQLLSLTKALTEGKVSVGTGSSVASVSPTSGGVSGNAGSLNNLPSMVGGC